MRTSIVLLIFFAFAVLTLFGFVTLKPIFNKSTDREGGSPASPALLEGETPSLTFINPVRGDKGARLAVVEYGDYLCSFCATMEGALGRVLKEFDGRVKLVWKDFPLKNLHPLAPKAALAGRCAGEEGKFWEFHDAALQSQDALQSEANLLELANSLNLGDDFRTCYQNKKMEARIQADFEEGAKLGVDGAPYFFIGNERLSGAVSYEKFKEVIEQELQNNG